MLTAIVFLSTAALVLFGSHMLLYYSLVKFFDIVNPTAKYGLLIATLVLAVSFLAVSMMVRFQENVIAKMLYFASSFWLGLLVNLLMACAVIWFLRFIFINNKIISGAILILASLYAVYGVWNAFHPQIKNIEVTIKNLPQEWQGKKIVQLSDMHIGIVHGQKFLQDIINKTNSLKPDMVVITGDLFDGMDGADGLPQLIDSINAPQGIYFITGNHETYFGLEKAFNILKSTKIKVLNDELVNLNGLQLVGISYPTERTFNESRNIKTIIESMSNFVKGQPTILLYHSPMPSVIAQAKEAGVNLQLSGHTHRGQIFPFRFITSYIYKGYDYGLRTEGDFNIYTSNGVGTWGPPMRTGNTPEIVAITLK